MKRHWRLDNIGWRLHEAVNKFDARVLELQQQSGYRPLSLSQLHATRNLDDDGTRLSELAKRAGMTKAAMGELVNQVERNQSYICLVEASARLNHAGVVVFGPLEQVLHSRMDRTP